MKRFCLIFFLSGITIAGVSQTFDEAWLDISFEAAEDYKKSEGSILQCANYILSVPMNDFNRQNALNPVAKWMAGTPDHNFIIGEKIMKLNEENEFVISVYMAACAQYALENAASKPAPEDVELKAYERMLAYMENRDNHFRITKGIRKAIDARNKGKLKEFIK